MPEKMNQGNSKPNKESTMDQIGNGLERIGKKKRPVMTWVLAALLIVGIVIGAVMCGGHSKSETKTPAKTESAG